MHELSDRVWDARLGLEGRPLRRGRAVWLPPVLRGQRARQGEHAEVGGQLRGRRHDRCQVAQRADGSLPQRLRGCMRRQEITLSSQAHQRVSWIVRFCSTVPVKV